MRSLISHLRYTVRLLLKSPGFTATTILILGFGIGMNTAVFSLINSVGVVGHVQQSAADFPQPAFQAYFPCAQLPYNNQCLLLRTRVDPHGLVPVVRKLFAAIDPDVLVAEVTTYDDLVGQLTTTRRLGVVLTSLFSCSALFLSSVGLYGILAYSVSQRAREIGVRIALGAQATNILRLIIRHGLKIF
jgi:hypothetical protein